LLEFPTLSVLEIRDDDLPATRAHATNASEDSRVGLLSFERQRHYFRAGLRRFGRAEKVVRLSRASPQNGVTAHSDFSLR